MNTKRRITSVSAALLASVLGAGCANVSDEARLREQAVQDSPRRLDQRERVLERAIEDLAHFRRTHRHMEENARGWFGPSFDPFLERFVEERVDPLLSNDWQSSHPEISQLDVDLRLRRTEALIDLGKKRPAARSIRDIARRYHRQQQMLVRDSLGRRVTLAEGIVLLERQLDAL